MKFDLIIKNGLVVFRDEVKKSDIAIRDGKISAIGENVYGNGAEIVDAEGQYVMPGMIDTHVHICEPGRTEWEGFITGSMALAAGGTTTYVDMPLNALPATTTKEALELKIKAAEGKNYVDYAFHGGLVPGNLEHLQELSDGGVVAYKCFMSTCGSDIPGDFKNVDDYTLYKGMKKLAELGHVLLIHAENASITDRLAEEKIKQGKITARDYVESRPIIAEVEAVKRALLFAKETGCKLHFVHISSAAAIEEIIKSRNEGQDVTLESCPHYFTLTVNQFEQIGPVAKCAPPLRDETEQEKLWKALKQGKIDMLTSDHSPCPPEMKHSDINNMFEVWGGITGCQNNVDLMFDEAVKKRNIPVTLFARMIATNPARRFNLKTKGEIAVSKDADIILIDPNQSYTVSKEHLYYRHKHSPYIGRTIHCRVTKTFVRGHLVYDLEKGILGEPIGQLLKGEKKEMLGV
ncbi:allantoinase AllB [Parageobacillus thermoglucosidasius]|uniref:allantoinase AllB n=1 Tax=Parageobacillus thermoglucosidasius TaxID=1426 RepID=UPI000B57EA38|nr:allantoinase AllB [Parageobacillus thermoglucosidasius]MBY6270302.1 allantoinase AllB [Parageobacillus thermoglucosidasius]OUM93100.1 MAG: allantoinase [Parageobacillus thermoglucosidasius]